MVKRKQIKLTKTQRHNLDALTEILVRKTMDEVMPEETVRRAIESALLRYKSNSKRVKVTLTITETNHGLVDRHKINMSQLLDYAIDEYARKETR